MLIGVCALATTQTCSDGPTSVAESLARDTVSRPDLRLGDSVRLGLIAAAQTLPAGVVWASSDTSILTTDTWGRATAVGVGTVIVTATGSDSMLFSRQLHVGPATLVGAGDIGRCSTGHPDATAALLDSIPGVVFTAGDNVYEDGTSTEWNTCYARTWGRHKGRTHPSMGNHDFYTDSGGPYYDYWGAAAGERGKGYYSYNIGPWHIVVLNSMVNHSTGSPQELWLRADLGHHKAHCTLAYFHYPRFSSGREQHSDPGMQPVWQDLYDAGADVVISGHSHVYERFAPQTPSGQTDSTRGIREFVVGTGGASLLDFDIIEPNSEVRDNSTYGVIRLRLYRGHYEWDFIPVAGGQLHDSGAAACHRYSL